MNPVFILSLFDTGYYAARMLRKTGIPIYGFDHYRGNPGFYSKYITPFVAPDPQRQPDELLKMLINKRREFNDKPLLLPASESYLEFICRKWSLLEEEFLFCLPSPDVLSRIIQKSDQIEMAEKAGLDVPKYRVVDKRADIDEIDGSLAFPVIVKGINQTGWKTKVAEKAFIASNMEEFIAIAVRLLAEDISFIVQETVPGGISNNYEYNALMINGDVIQAHVIQKKQQFPLKVGAACCIQTVENKQVEDLGFKFITTSRLEGFSNTEFKLDLTSGKYYFIETNARIWQQIELTEKCGDNFLRRYYDNLVMHRNLGDATSIFPSGKIWIDLPAYLLLLIRYKKESGISYAETVRTLVKAKSYGLFNLRDPLPFLHSVGVICTD